MDRQFWVGSEGKLNPNTQIHSWREHNEAQFWYIDEEGRLKAHGGSNVHADFLGDYVGMRDGGHSTQMRFKVDEASDSFSLDDVDLKEAFTTETWYAGDFPHERANPWLFRKDGTFATLRDEHGGKWQLVRERGILKLKMVWNTVEGHAIWEDDGSDHNGFKFRCTSNNWGFMLAWKLWTVEQKQHVDKHAKKEAKRAKRVGKKFHWTVHENIDMCGQGDVEIIGDWKNKHSLDDLKKIC